jgi:hypothetical protein
MAIAGVGVIYVVVIAIAAVTGQFVFPPSQPIQLFGAVVTILAAPAMLVMMACLHVTVPDRHEVLTVCALGFTILFAAMVSINRFVQLTVIRQGLLHGAAEQLQLFMPYGSNSIMLSLEILGWGLFHSLAFLCVAPVFAGGRIERWLRGLLITYGVIGIVSALGLVSASPISAVGFIAWGPVLDAIAVLMAIWFRRRMC